MKKREAFPVDREIPLWWLLSAVPAMKDSLPTEMVDNVSDYKLRMDDKRTAFLVGYDDEGYFVRATEVYRLYK